MEGYAKDRPAFDASGHGRSLVGWYPPTHMARLSCKQSPASPSCSEYMAFRGRDFHYLGYSVPSGVVRLYPKCLWLLVPYFSVDDHCAWSPACDSICLLSGYRVSLYPRHPGLCCLPHPLISQTLPSGAWGSFEAYHVFRQSPQWNLGFALGYTG